MFRKFCTEYYKDVPQLGITFVRTAVSSSSIENPVELKPIKISKNLSLRPATNSQFDDHERPIVLLYGWLVAKANHISKYGDFYLGKGFDVLHVKVTPDQLLRPRHAQNVVESVLNFVSEGRRVHQPILHHGFSVGGYLYGETLVKILDNEQRFGNIGQRLRGQIFDSPVSMSRIPFGTSRAVTDNKILQNFLESSLDGYLKLFHNYTTKHFLKSQEYLMKNDLGVPSLFLYSEDDVVAEAQTIREVISGMEGRGIFVDGLCFSGSPHVRHFHIFPEEYIKALNMFLIDIGLAVPQRKKQINVSN